MIHRIDYGPHDVWRQYENPLAFLTVAERPQATKPPTNASDLAHFDEVLCESSQGAPGRSKNAASSITDKKGTVLEPSVR